MDFWSVVHQSARPSVWSGLVRSTGQLVGLPVWSVGLSVNQSVGQNRFKRFKPNQSKRNRDDSRPTRPSQIADPPTKWPTNWTDKWAEPDSRPDWPVIQPIDRQTAWKTIDHPHNWPMVRFDRLMNGLDWIRLERPERRNDWPAAWLGN